MRKLLNEIYSNVDDSSDESSSSSSEKSSGEKSEVNPEFDISKNENENEIFRIKFKKFLKRATRIVAKLKEENSSLRDALNMTIDDNKTISQFTIRSTRNASDRTLTLSEWNCKQGNRTLEEYIDEFIHLNSWNLLPDNENMQITRFLGGLKREIQDQMKMLNSFTLGQAFDLARKAEEPFRAPPVLARFTNQQFQAGPSRVTTPNEPAVEASGVKNRPKRVVPQQSPNLDARPIPSLCYKCHQPRHRSNQCQQRPGVNFVEGDYHEAEIVDGIEEDREDDFTGMVEQ
ncbi:hypothetical protein LWI28_020027 [Acer negundo]|uniref:CCHC-type domain-containing protein n=1 Tax=Acer negundo TaxID=4023 RepID=A0AAD5JDM6_ACENE|nr:hypothetical protein LWI28_020027 [Acer negundo]